jgi:hypothetical protein
MESYGRVVWSPVMQVEAERAAQRPAPELPVDRRGHQGNIGHVTLRSDGARPNERGAVDVRLGHFNRESERCRRP